MTGALSVVLGIVQVIAASHAASLQRGYRWTASPRDEQVEPLRGVAGRLDRALRNFVETFPLFAAVVLVAHVTDTHDALTEWGARLYFWGRLCLRAPLCGRSATDPLAGVERCHDRHRVDRRCPTIELRVHASVGPGEPWSYAGELLNPVKRRSGIAGADQQVAVVIHGYRVDVEVVVGKVGIFGECGVGFVYAYVF